MKKIRIALLTTYCFLFSYSFSQKMGSIKDDINGFTFQDDTDLYYILYNILTRNYILKGKNLLPISFTKQYNIQLLNNFLNKLINEK